MNFPYQKSYINFNLLIEKLRKKEKQLRNISYILSIIIIIIIIIIISRLGKIIGLRFVLIDSNFKSYLKFLYF